MSDKESETGKVIQFPKNKIKENKDKMNKLEVACKILRQIAMEGNDFHIIVTREAADNLFIFPSEKYSYATITSNLNEIKNIPLYKDTFIYPISGDEFQ